MSEKITNEKWSPSFKWVILSIAALINALLVGYQSTSLAITIPTIIEELGWTTTMYSNIMAAQALGVTFLILFSGVLLDKLSTKWLLSIATILCGITIGARYFIHGYTPFYISMLAFGVGASIYQPATTRVASLWFDRENIFMANGLLIATISIGALLGSRLSPRINEAIGWRTHFAYLAVVVFAVAVLWMIIAKDRSPRDSALVTEGTGGTEGEITFADLKDNLKVILSSKVVWILLFVEFFGYGAQHSNTTFAATTIIKGWGMDAVSASKIIVWNNYGALLGLVVLPIISDRIGKRKNMVMGGWIIRGALLIVGMISMNPVIAMASFFVSGLAAGAGIPGARTMIVEQPGIGGLRAGTAIGALLFVGAIGNVVISNVYSAVINATNNYVFGIVSAYAFFFAAALLVYFVPESGLSAETNAK